MSRSKWSFYVFSVLMPAALGGSLLSAAPTRAQLKPRIIVDTTADLPVDALDCLPGNPCPLRGAIEKAQSIEGGAIITACVDPEIVPDAAPCRGGRSPLSKDDANFDPVTGKWTLELRLTSLPLVLTRSGTELDFRYVVDDYGGPQDNRIVLDNKGVAMQHALKLETNDTLVAGFDVRGAYSDAAILLQSGLFGEGASNNRVGPGLAFAGITDGNGLRIVSSATVNNHVVGNWCGITGDGTMVDPVAEDCIYILDGARGNQIGGPAPDDANVFSASSLGVGVKIEGSGTDGNAIVGNWIGLDATGEPSGSLSTGISIVDGVAEARVSGNVISGLRGDGIEISSEVSRTAIEDNRIGAAPEGGGCASNGGYGVSLQFGPTDTMIARNVVRCNERGGVVLTGRATTDNTITQNSITDNGGRAIVLAQRANEGLSPPRIVRVSRDSVIGTSCSECSVEVFTDPAGEAANFEGRTVAGVGGEFELVSPTGFRFRTLTASSTSGKNTSELSEMHVVPEGPTEGPSPTATIAPTVGPTPTGGLFVERVFLPWAGRGAHVGALE